MNGKWLPIAIVVGIIALVLFLSPVVYHLIK